MSLSRQAVVSKAGRRQTNLPAAGPFSFAPHPWHTLRRERANLDPDGVSSVEIFSRATDDTLWAVVATVAKTDRIAEVFRTRAAALEDWPEAERARVVGLHYDNYLLTVDLEDQAAQGEIVEVEREDGMKRIGVIKIPTFYVDFDAWQAGEEEFRSTTRDVAREVERLKEEGIDGIMLDLRNNGGGALQEANSLIGLFIDRGPTVQVRDARGRISLYGDTEAGTLYDGPLAVLVNRLSASASEIFAGAIQDYGRGLVLGNATFGKGTVQTLSDLSHGQIKLTRAKFYRISGESTQHRGVEPDILFPNLVDPERIGESSLDNALEWDTVQEVQYRHYGEPWEYMETLRSRHRERADTHPNFVFLEQRADMARRLREEHTSVSLDREQRQREVEARDAEQLSLENQRREALGLDLLEELVDARDEDDEDEPVERVQVTEAAAILADYAELTQRRMASRF
mgnify:CR=1 FL=1